MDRKGAQLYMEVATVISAQKNNALIQLGFSRALESPAILKTYRQYLKSSGARGW